MERNVRDSVSCAAFKLRATQPAAILSSQVARPALLTGEPVFLTGGLVLATHSRGVMWPTTVSQNAPSRGISDVVCLCETLQFYQIW